MKAGLNLFSLRKSITTEADFLATANRLKEMGYSYLQFSGASFDAEMIARVSGESGMPVYLTHVPMDRILGDTEKLMEEHALFGCKNIGLGAMPKDAIKDETLCKKTIEELNAAGEKMRQNGFNFFYHHHHFEFYKHNGETVFDYMIRNAPYINFTVDTYWLQYGGVSVTEFIEKLAGRIECVHLKDYLIDFPLEPEKEQKFTPRFCPVGDGTINFRAAVEQAKKSGAKYFFVEQDNAPLFADPFEQVGRSINYITKEL